MKTAKKQRKKASGLWEYVKCAYANKFTFTGYVSLVLLPVVFYVQRETGIDLDTLNVSLGLSAALGLCGTGGGLQTLDTYQKTKKHIRQYETIDENFMLKSSRLYCVRAGMRLAAKEEGLEHLL